MGEMAVQESSKVADALIATNPKILHILSAERLDVSIIAERLKPSEAYVSEQVSLLERS